MKSAWTFALARLAGALAFAVVGGLVFGRVDLWLVGVLAGYLLLQLANLYRLHRWLKHRREEDPPDLGGVWGDVVALVGRIHRRKNFHKRRIAQLLREFRRLTAAMPEGMILLSPEREIVWFNRTAAQLLGLRRKLDFGMRIENLVRQPEFTRYLESGPQASPVVVRYGPSSDRFLTCQLIQAGEQLLLMVRDVTREARLEHMRKDFVANASHELRTPLTVVYGFLETLTRDGAAVPERWRRPLDLMTQQTLRMQRIIDDMLMLAQLEGDGGRGADSDVNIPNLLQLIRSEAIALSGSRGHRIEVDADPSLWLRGNEAELRSAVANLVGNAVQHTPDGSAISVRWQLQNDSPVLEVQDNGEGIAAEHLPRLSERFYRVDASRSRARGGTGLGLAIVKHAMARHDAELRIRSQVGQGSTFSCVFAPALARRMPAAPAATNSFCL